MSYDKKYRPQIGHWTDKFVIYQDGSLGTTFHITGQNAELMDEAALIAARQDINQLALSTTHPRLQWWQHFTRIGQQKAPPLAPCTTWWAQGFDRAVDQHCMGNLYRNDLFFTLIARPRSDIAASLKNAWRSLRGLVSGGRGLSLPSATNAFLEDFENTASKTMNSLKHLGARQLGMRQDEKTGEWFSEVWEAHHLIGNGFFRPIPVCNGTDRAGRQVVPARVIFGHREYQIVAEGAEQRGAILGFANYPSSTHPLMFEKVKSANFDLTITNSFEFKATQRAIDQLDFKTKQLGATLDSPRQAKQIAEGKEDLQSNMAAYGRHHFSLTVRRRTQEELNHSVWEAEEMIAKGGATIVRYDSKTIKPAFYAQFPGLARWRVRRGGILSINFAGFAALNNVPSGTLRSRWGGPIFYLRTTRDTIYPYHFHVTGDPNIPKEDVASWFTLGGMGSGKTSYTARKLAGSQRVGARSIILDKDCGLAPFVLANDGEYFVLADGEDSGVVPLKGLRGTPDDVNHLHQFILGLIESDGRGGITPTEDGALASQIEFQMSLPVELRSIDGIWPMLGRDPEGAGARLRKWGRGQRMGWAFDGKKDRVNITASMLGYDTTALLKNPAVCEPMLTHLFYRFQGIIYQRKPLVISLDECWQTIGNNPGAAVDNKRFVARFDDDSKTIRKNEGAIGLITQNAEALLKSTMASTIQQNMPTKEFFGDRQARSEHLVDGYKLTPREFHIVTNVLPAMRHALLVKRPDSSFIARNDLSGISDHVTILSGRRSTYDLLLLLRDRFGYNSRDWVPHYQRLAPLVVDDPHLDLNDLIEGRSNYVKSKVLA